MENTIHRYVMANSTEFNIERQYVGKTSFFGSEPPLSQAVGYMVVLVFGAAFSIFTTLIVHIEKLSTKKRINSEMFK
jgi:hypothetical protein